MKLGSVIRQKNYNMKINMYQVALGGEERQAVDRVLASGKLAQGEVVAEFEKSFARFIGVKYACATVNGTVALELALLALGIGPGDEVITTPFSFIATANAILYTGARPVFVDIIEDTFNLNPELIAEKITSKTKAILPVHLYGLPAEMEKIMKIASRHNLEVVEDACQAHGAETGGKKVGSIGAAGCFSFYPTKNMTTGEGGIITTNSEEIYDQANLLRNHGSKVKYYHDILGYNFRMTDIGAAIGLEQLKKLSKFNLIRQKNASWLTKNLSNIPGLTAPFVGTKMKHVFHQYTIRITEEFGFSRDEVLQKLTEAGIGTAVFYPLPINEQKVYQKLGYKSDTSVAKKVSGQVISLPVQPALKLRDLEYIVKVIKKLAE